MGLIIGFSLVITFFVLLFQLAVFSGGLILFCFVASRLVSKTFRNTFFKKASIGVVCVVSIMFAIMFVTYFGYLTTSWTGKTVDNAISRYWKENLGQGTIGTVSFMNPVLSPILYLLPKDKPKKSHEQSNLGPQPKQK